jgi:hypothetical protein
MTPGQAPSLRSRVCEPVSEGAVSSM